MMSLFVDGERVPTRWAALKDACFSVPLAARASRDSVKIALINNMPDPALEDTEMQFFGLLESAAGNIPVSVKLFSLPELPRTERGRQHLTDFYCPMEHLWKEHFDALIMTGTEPIQRDLTKEAYWPHLTTVLDWAERNTASSILSCLATHAAVLHSDGIERHLLPDKRFGVFEFSATPHAMTRDIGQVVKNPHSRWNEVREEALTANGYRVLTRSDGAGVDLFVKVKRDSLFVHFQGHPEYSVGTLLKEYRRDVRRFLRRERESYPGVPQGYFGACATNVLNDFQEIALHIRNEELMAAFPEAVLSQSLLNDWRHSAISIYRNWLGYVVARKAGHSLMPALPANQGVLPASASFERY